MISATAQLKWFVHVVYTNYQEKNGPRFFLIRAYSWQDAHDSIKKDRYRNLVWDLRPLEPNGTFYDGQSFVKVDPLLLRQAGIETE